MVKAHFSYGLLNLFLLLSLSGHVVLFASGCGFQDRPPALEGEERQGKKTDAVPAQQSAEAEKLFAQAEALWQKSGSSAVLGEVCSDPAQAIALLDKAIALDPAHAAAYVRRGLAKSDAGDPEGAFEDLTAGIRLASSPEAYARRGLVLLRDNQIKAAERDLAYSLQITPSQHLAHNYMGVLELSRSDTAAACKAFQKGCSQGDCSFLESARKEKLCP